MFVEDPENPVRNAHICAPKNLGFADARRELIGLCAKLHDDVDHRTPQQLRHALSESVDKPEHSNLDVTERFEYLDYMKNGPNGKSDTIRRALQRNKSRFDPMMLGALVREELIYHLMLNLPMSQQCKVKKKYDLFAIKHQKSEKITRFLLTEIRFMHVYFFSRIRCSTISATTNV